MRQPRREWLLAEPPNSHADRRPSFPAPASSAAGLWRGAERGCGDADARTSERLSSSDVMLLWLEPSRITLVAPGAPTPKSRGLNCVVRERVAPHCPGFACSHAHTRRRAAVNQSPTAT